MDQQIYIVRSERVETEMKLTVFNIPDHGGLAIITRQTYVFSVHCDAVLKIKLSISLIPLEW